tara:strand:- start:699 stop:917 length:219 start_codon:yes stop_codon:yes gene_type:complete
MTNIEESSTLDRIDAGLRKMIEGARNIYSLKGIGEGISQRDDLPPGRKNYYGRLVDERIVKLALNSGRKKYA